MGGGGELNLDDVGNPIRRPFVFPWAVAAQPKIITVIPLQEGTATIAQNSTSVTSSSINSATTDLTGWHIQFIGTPNPTVYYISAHSGTTITLDGAQVAEAASGVAFKAFKLIYSVGSDILLTTDKLRAYTLRGDGYWVSMVEPRALFDRWPLARISEGSAQEAAIIKQTNGTLQLQLSHAPTEYQRLELWYVPKPTDLNVSGSSDPILPSYRTVLVHLAAFYHLRRRDDDRAQSHFSTAKQLFDCLTTEARQIVNANDENYGYVAPWPGGFAGSSLRSISVDIP